MSDRCALGVRRAHKRFGDVAALAGLDLAIAAGEWVALLGPNGAGKTTLMCAIAGLVELDSGEVELLGTRLAGRAARRARQQLGFVPQEIALYGSLTARENLETFGRLNGIAGRRLRERIAEALAWTRLEDRADQIVAGFSGGMQRRLNIACGVLHRPRVVLLDEPTVGVDPQGRQRIWEMLEELRRSGTALLQSTHQLDEIETVTDRVVIVDHGRVIARGTLDELLAHHLERAREVRLTLDRPPAGLELANGFRVEDKAILGTAHDVAAEVRDLLDRVRAAGLEVHDLRVEAPGLEAVFTHLTGRDLRE